MTASSNFVWDFENVLDTCSYYYAPLAGKNPIKVVVYCLSPKKIKIDAVLYINDIVIINMDSIVTSKSPPDFCLSVNYSIYTNPNSFDSSSQTLYHKQ